jgi:hypothetical protein
VLNYRLLDCIHPWGSQAGKRLLLHLLPNI